MAFVGSCALIGSTVATSRKALHMTQRQLADSAGVGVRFIVDLEAGKETVRMGLVLVVLSALGMNLNLEKVGCTPIKDSGIGGVNG